MKPLPAILLAVPLLAWLILPAQRLAAADNSPAATYANDRLAALEGQIAELIQSRPDPPAVDSLLELRIDLRVIDRWYCQQAAAAKESGAQVNLILRDIQIQSALGQLEDLLKGTPPPPPPDAAQTGSLNRLHQVSFHLGDKKGETPDEVSQEVGITLLAIVGRGDLKAIPMMRPKPATQPASGGGDEPHTPADFIAAARAAVAPPAVHRGLQGLAAIGYAPGAKGDQAEQARRLLAQALKIVGDLNAAGDSIPAEVRDKAMEQLSQSLALLADSRTADSGAVRFQAVSASAPLIAHLARIHMGKDMATALAPLLGWAQDNPDSGEKAVTCVEKYAELIARVGGRTPGAGLSQQYQTTIADLQKQFDGHVEGFATEAARFGHDTPPQEGLSTLDQHVAEMTRLADLIDAIQTVPHSLATLAPLKPKPYGGLEKWSNNAVVVLLSASKPADRAGAARFLLELHQLGGLASRLLACKTDDLPPHVVELYTGQSLAAFNQKWRQMVSDQATLEAAGQPLNMKIINRLETAREMMQSLTAAAVAEQNLAKIPDSRKWADWSITPELAEAMLAPYRDSMSATFAGFGEVDAGGSDHFLIMRKRYQPLLAMLEHAAGQTDALAELPGGLRGQAAGLITPLEDAPFAHERWACVQLNLWRHFSADPKTADAILDNLSKRLREELAVGE